MKMTMKKTKQTTMESMDEFVCLFSLFLFFKDNFHIYSCIFINKKKIFIFQNPDENDDDV